MIDWFAIGLDVQRDLLRAQKAQMDAAQKLLDAGREAARLQQAGRKAAEANLAVWKQWSSLWGWK